jgi:hypothetical protein
MSSEEEGKSISVDAFQEAMIDFATALEAACVQFKQRVGQLHGVGVSEEPFLALVGWTKSQGGKIGEFEYTTRQANNNSDGFNHCMNILRANNADIRNHFGEKGWRYYYWLWLEGQPDTIYRKQRNQQGPKQA